MKEKVKKSPNLAACEKLRHELHEVSELTNDVTDDLPNDPNWPELHDILRRF